MTFIDGLSQIRDDRFGGLDPHIRAKQGGLDLVNGGIIELTTTKERSIGDVIASRVRPSPFFNAESVLLNSPMMSVGGVVRLGFCWWIRRLDLVVIQTIKDAVDEAWRTARC